MSHPERLGSPGGEPVDATADPPHPNGKISEPLADFATRHGLTQSAARPSLRAYIKELWGRRNFIWAFASSKAISAYTSSKLGQLWQVLTPLLNAGVYLLIFGYLLNVSRGVSNLPPWLVTGVFVFTFTQRSVTAGAKSVGNNLSLIRALHFPRACMPFAYVIVELQQLLIAMGVLTIIVLAFGEPMTWYWVLVIPALLLQLVFNIGLSLVVARLGAFVRDIQQLLPFVLRTWLYLSGVIFPIARLTEDRLQVPDWVAHVLAANPGSVFIELVRYAMIESYRGDLAGWDWGGSYVWWYAVGWAVLMFVGGFWFFYRAEERYGRG